jgi:hypothetical protein
MSDKRQLIPIAGLLATMAIASYMVAELDGQATAAATANFTNAAVAEVRDAQGLVVLHGQFVLSDEDDDDTERKAVLTPTGLDGDAGGNAEVEFAQSAPVTQEVEFSVRGLQPGVTFTFVIDGHEVATATTDRRGRAEVERDVRLPGAAASR